MATEKIKKLRVASDALYDKCHGTALIKEEGSADPLRHSFNQEELLSLCDDPPLDNILTAQGLMPLIQDLTASNLFIPVKNQSTGLAWTLRSRDAAQKVSELGSEEKMVYTYVEDTYTDGLPHRHLKSRCGLTDKGIDRAVCRLATLRLIRIIKTAKNNGHKLYILRHLKASEHVTGGTFYDEGELDDTLIRELSNLVVRLVYQHSWAHERRRKVKSDPAPPPDDAQAKAGADSVERVSKKRKHGHASETIDIEDVTPNKKPCLSKSDAASSSINVQASFRRGHHYPTTADIHGFITNGDILRGAAKSSLTMEEMQIIIDVLVWDDVLEPVRGGYRTIRGIKPKDQPAADPNKEAKGITMEEIATGITKPHNSLVEMPCGRCPIMDLCEDGGPVTASSCVYMKQWLQGITSDKDKGAVVEIG